MACTLCAKTLRAVDQPVPVVGVEVVARAGEQIGDRRDLGEVLVDVRGEPDVVRPSSSPHDVEDRIRSRQARNAASRRTAAGPGRASARSAQRSPPARAPAWSAASSGRMRSLSTRPEVMLRPRCSAPANNASIADAKCEPNTSADVVPECSRPSRNSVARRLGVARGRRACTPRAARTCPASPATAYRARRSPGSAGSARGCRRTPARGCRPADRRRPRRDAPPGPASYGPRATITPSRTTMPPSWSTASASSGSLANGSPGVSITVARYSVIEPPRPSTAGCGLRSARSATAATPTAMTAGSLPVSDGLPIGQVILAIGCRVVAGVGELRLEPDPLRARPDQPDAAQVRGADRRVAEGEVLGVVVGHDQDVRRRAAAAPAPSRRSSSGARSTSAVPSVTSASRSGSSCSGRESTRCSWISSRDKMRASS